MKLHHAAMWMTNSEREKEYFVRYFGAKANQLYENKTTGFKSYFFSFVSESELEIMHRADIPVNLNDIETKQHLLRN